MTDGIGKSLTFGLASGLVGTIKFYPMFQWWWKFSLTLSAFCDAVCFLAPTSAPRRPASQWTDHFLPFRFYWKDPLGLMEPWDFTSSGSSLHPSFHYQLSNILLPKNCSTLKSDPKSMAFQGRSALAKMNTNFTKHIINLPCDQ